MSLPPRNFLITGATGFVGSRMVRRLLSLGHHVRSIVRRAGETPEFDSESYEEVLGDFVDAGLARRAAEGCDVVVHAAATAGPDMDPVRRVNTEGTRSMIEAATGAGASRYIQVSTVSVYAVAGITIVDEAGPLKTNAEPYGTTKAEGDRLVLEAAARGLRATIVRPGAILGVHPTSTWAVKIPQRIRDRVTKLQKDGGNTLPFIHVEDLVDAILLAFESDAAAGRVYNVIERNSTWREYADEVRRWFGTAPLDSVPEAEAASMTYWTGQYSADRLRRELGWAPGRTFSEGMAEAERYWAGRLVREADNA